jgi:type IV secretory pathway TrbL component
MQNVRPAGFARPHDGQTGPDGASDAAAGATGPGAAGGVAAGDDAGGTGTCVAATGVAAPGVSAPGVAAAGGVAGVPASSAANSRNAPQLPQNASPAAFCVPHFAQIIRLLFASLDPSLGAA